MFKTLLIENFQKHAKLEIDFDKEITTIRGTTDAGKSSVIRALRWLCLNQPRGTEFLRYGAKKVRVTLFTDTHIIARERGSKNLYFLGDANTPEDKWKEFVSFGNNVPEEIQNVLRVTDTNFQNQHDAPFWFSESAGEVSRQLNQIIDLSIIDSTLSNLNALVRNSRAILAVTKTRLEEARQDRNNLKFVRGLRKELISLESLEAETLQDAHTRSLIDELLSGYTRLSTEGESRLGWLRRAQTIQHSGEILFTFQGENSRLSAQIVPLQKYSEQLAQEIPSISALKKQEESIEVLSGKHDNLLDLVEDLEEKMESILTTNSSLAEAQEKLDKFQKERCPLCGQKPKS